MTRSFCLAIALSALPALAFAQQSSVFTTRGISWSPTLTLQEFGWDSNIENAPANPVSDMTATVKPGADASVNLAHAKLSGAALLELVYYDQSTRDRAFNRRLNGRAEFPLNALTPYVAFAQQGAKDRPTPEVDTPQRHSDLDVNAGASVPVSSRVAIQFAGRRQTTTYDKEAIVRGVSAATALDYRQLGATVGVRIALTPLTSLGIDLQRMRATYPLSPLKTDESSASHVSLEFAPDAVIRGHAGIGWHKQTSRDLALLPYNGVVFDVDLGYVLLDVTRITGRYNKDTAVSVEAPYYVSTAYGLDVSQAFVGPTELIARYTRTNADYPGDLTRAITPRLDTLDIYGGGVAILMGKGSRMTVTYEIAKRQSVLELLTYDRQRLFTSFVLGL
ncbi:MAG TPA: outer membrane beta-barrel protein [Vicinamibacterales bacterium]|jgi:hypothetical protein|nr:outer membrane beta-barrel protein [Vicinamibacterales bacterium]